MGAGHTFCKWLKITPEYDLLLLSENEHSKFGAVSVMYSCVLVGAVSDLNLRNGRASATHALQLRLRVPPNKLLAP